MERKAKYEKADLSPNGNRFCSTCYLHRDSVGGYWKIAPHGKNRRWLCSHCIKYVLKTKGE